MLQVLYFFMLQGFSLILNGLFIKVNINSTDFSLLKGLISGLLQSILESSSGIPMWNPYVESPCGIPIWNPYVESLCGIPCGIPIWNPCLESLLGIEITANFSGSKFNTRVIPERKKIKHNSKGITWNQQIHFINDWTLLLRSNQNYNARGSEALGHLWIQDLRTYTCNATLVLYFAKAWKMLPVGLICIFFYA